MHGSSRKFGVRTSRVMCHPHALMCLFWLSATSQLSSLGCPSTILSSWPSTSSSMMWWTSSLCTPANEDLGTLAEYDPSPTTTTSRRLLNRTSRNPRSRMGPRMNSSTMTLEFLRFSYSLFLQSFQDVIGLDFRNWSRNPLARTGPWTRMTLNTMTAWRSLHHSSPQREKMQRAVDEPITLKTKVCRPVSRCPWVMKERSDPFWNRLTRKFQMSENFRAAAQKVSKSGFFWSDKESRFSLTVKQRFENTSSRPIMTEEIFKNWMKWSSL